MKLTLSEVARQAGMSKSTLSRLVKKGRITAEKQENGEFRIDPSELDRLADLRSSRRSVQRIETGTDAVLQREIDLLREMLLDKERTIQDLRTERDDWKKQAQQAQQAQMLLLAVGEKKKEEPRKRWWPWRK
jgi:excisionase family DNA binding protein